MNGTAQTVLRTLTHATRPLAMRSAGKAGSKTAVIRHVGRRSGARYETPVVTAKHDDRFLIALPYGDRTDWMHNVLRAGTATLVANGQTYEVDQPEIVPMAEATRFFDPREQRMHRKFHVDSALMLHERTR